MIIDELEEDDDAKRAAIFRTDASFYLVPNPCSDPKLSNTFAFEAVNHKDFYINYDKDNYLVMGSLSKNVKDGKRDFCDRIGFTVDKDSDFDWGDVQKNWKLANPLYSLEYPGHYISEVGDTPMLGHLEKFSIRPNIKRVLPRNG